MIPLRKSHFSTVNGEFILTEMTKLRKLHIKKLPNAAASSCVGPNKKKLGMVYGHHNNNPLSLSDHTPWPTFAKLTRQISPSYSARPREFCTQGIPRAFSPLGDPESGPNAEMPTAHPARLRCKQSEAAAALGRPSVSRSRGPAGRVWPSQGLVDFYSPHSPGICRWARAAETRAWPQSERDTADSRKGSTTRSDWARSWLRSVSRGVVRTRGTCTSVGLINHEPPKVGLCCWQDQPTVGHSPSTALPAASHRHRATLCDVMLRRSANFMAWMYSRCTGIQYFAGRSFRWRFGCFLDMFY